jgi:hypothetical protein
LQSIPARFCRLLAELALESAEDNAVPDYDEIAGTAWRILQLPDIAALRARLVPEWPIYVLLAGSSSPSALAGRIDAIAYEGDHTEAVIDWKSV